MAVTKQTHRKEDGETSQVGANEKGNDADQTVHSSQEMEVTKQSHRKDVGETSQAGANEKGDDADQNVQSSQEIRVPNRQEIQQVRSTLKARKELNERKKQRERGLFSHDTQLHCIPFI